MLSYLNPLPSLPAYRGPHRVGTAEFEIPTSEISSVSSAPDAGITTIKFRLYYPTRKDAKSKQSAHWLPEPQKEWNDAYASFMGSSSRLLPLTSRILGMWSYATLPAVKDAALLPPKSSNGYPVCIFSHGIGGNFNTYSSVVGNLASCGVVCIALEHRDGSGPVTFVKSAKGEISTAIPYRKHAHSPTAEVLNKRNAQLRIRCWELELTYAVIKAMNEGKQYSNFADTDSSQLDLSGQLDLQPGQVTWAGHSYGAATVTQFVKSVYYHEHLPEHSGSTNGADDGEWDMTPLLRCVAGSDLVEQIRPETPVALLDLWTMPLRGETTKWLWDRPLPSYYRRAQRGSNPKPNTVAVMSAEFYKWIDLLNRTRAVLSEDPVAAIKALESKKNQSEAPSLKDDNTRCENPIPELNKQEAEAATPQSLPSSTGSSRTPSPAPSDSEHNSATSSQTSIAPEDSELEKQISQSSAEPHLYLVPQSAHLSQSDFGVLFPSLTKYVMKAIQPEKTLELNVRAILAVMRNAGLPVESLVEGEDPILDSEKMDKKERWVRVPLVDA